MIVDVEVCGRSLKVDIGRDLITVDGRMLDVDVARSGLGWSILIAPAAAVHDAHSDAEANTMPREVGADWGRPLKSYDVAVARHSGGGAIVHVNGRLVPALVTGSAATFGSRVLAARVKPKGEGGPQRVLAPMPGRIVDVLVAVGDIVVVHQGLVVIEAMKMENELRSPKAGRISEVRVEKGASVDAHAVLVVVE